jgi:hypothetical protein
VETVGASFTAENVASNVRVAVCKPSLTVTVMVVVPLTSLIGVTVTVRFAPDPPNVIPSFATSAVFDETPESVRLPAPPLSPTVNAAELTA